MKTSDYRSLPTHYSVTTESVNVLTMMAMVIFFGLAFFMSSCTKDESFGETENREEPTSLKVGLVGHWDFRGNANDLSESGFHGAVTGATPTRDRHGRDNGAFSFNGISDHINLGNIEELSFGGFQPYTITSWVRPDTAGGNVISKWNGGVSAGWYLNVKSDMHISSYRNVVPWTAKSVDKVSDNEWVHLATKYDGSTLYVYINGVLQASQPFTSQPYDTRTDVLIGALHSRHKVAGFFQGDIDEVRLYNRDLTDDEIKILASN